MLFTSISSASTSTAATEHSFGAPTTSLRTPGGVTMRFGLKFPQAGGAAPTESTTTSTTTTTTGTTNTTTTITSGFNLNLRPLISPGINSNDPVCVSSVPLTSIVNSIVTPVMTYGQLDGLINKWSFALQDQEKNFLPQATQVNACDCALIESDKEMAVFRGRMKKVKLDYQRLKQELDFILSQQKELEDLLSPLVESVKEQSGPVYLQHAEEECETDGE